MMKRVFLYSLIGGVLAFNALVMTLGTMAQWPPNVDGAVYLAAARTFAAGTDPTTTPGYLYPPTLALVPIPPPLWLAFVWACTLALVPLLRLDFPLAFAAVLLFPPALGSAYVGNVNSLIAILLALALRKRPGLWLSVGALIKLTPGVGILILAVRREWRQVGIACGVALCVLPFAPLPYWITGALRATTAPIDLAASISWPALLPAAIAAPLCLALVIALLVAAPRLGAPDALAAASILPLLIARIAWTNHAVMALPALALLWNKSKIGRILAALTWLAFALDRSRIAMPLMLTLCLLYIAALPIDRRLIRRSAGRADAPAALGSSEGEGLRGDQLPELPV